MYLLTWKNVRLFQNSGFGKMFRPKTDEMTGDWCNLHKEEPALCSRSSLEIIRALYSLVTEKTS
jgi:hypothetical protein